MHVGSTRGTRSVSPQPPTVPGPLSAPGPSPLHSLPRPPRRVPEPQAVLGSLPLGPAVPGGPSVPRVRRRPYGYDPESWPGSLTYSGGSVREWRCPQGNPLGSWVVPSGPDPAASALAAAWESRPGWESGEPTRGRLGLAPAAPAAPFNRAATPPPPREPQIVTEGRLLAARHPALRAGCPNLQPQSYP